jgi:hypothetical protein
MFSDRQLDPEVLNSLRSSIQVLAYRAVTIERPLDDAALADMHALQARVMGLPGEILPILHEAELEIERRRLRANWCLTVL